MKRREFISLLGGAAAAWPVVARGQQSARELPRIAVLASTRSENHQAFLQGLVEAGYVPGQNMLMDEHFHEGALDQLDQVAREFVARKPSVIFASNPYAIRSAMKATNKIPIIGVDLESDPVASGLVKSLARPGGNFTGFFLDIPDLGGKQIELMMEAVSPVSRLAVVWDATIGAVQFRATERARRPSGVILKSLPIERAEDFNLAFERAVNEQVQGVVLLSSPLIFLQRPHIAEVALNARMPTISLFTSFPRLGGLMAYGPNFPSIYRQAASYVSRVLTGVNPGELPIQRPSKFELVINLKTAKTIGLSMPEALLIRADEVIE